MDNQTTEKVEIKKNKPVYFYAGIGLLAALLIVIIGIVGMVAYRSEKKFADDKFSLGVAKMIGLPAGFVNGNRIGYVEFIEDLQAVKESYKGATADQTPSEKEMRQNVWDMLVKNSVVRKEASKNNVVITDQDVNDEYDSLVKNVGSEEETETLIKNNYNWNKTQFKDRVLRPYVLQQKLASSDKILEKLGKEPEQRAQEVLKQVQEGKKSFEDLAKEYSEDSSKDNGGDLGWFGAGMMVTEFEKAVSELEVGKVSGLVQTEFGYHIIKLEEKRQNDKKETEWHAKHILIKTTDFDTYLSDLVKQAKIKKWLSL